MLDTLRAKKPSIFRRFLRQVNRPVVVPDDLSEDPATAYMHGHMAGRKSGYEDGLVDGVTLGMDLMEEALDRILCQPVVAYDCSPRRTA
jgi:hypothetical protein